METQSVILIMIAIIVSVLGAYLFLKTKMKTDGVSPDTKEEVQRLNNWVEQIKTSHQREIDLLNKQVSTLESEKNQANEELNEKRDESVKLMTELSASKQKVESLGNVINKHEADIDSLHQKQVQANKELKEQQGVVRTLSSDLSAAKEESAGRAKILSDRDSRIQVLTKSETDLKADLKALQETSAKQGESLASLREEGENKAQTITERNERITELTEQGRMDNQALESLRRENKMQAETVASLREESEAKSNTIKERDERISELLDQSTEQNGLLANFRKENKTQAEALATLREEKEGSLKTLSERDERIEQMRVSEEGKDRLIDAFRVKNAEQAEILATQKKQIEASAEAHEEKLKVMDEQREVLKKDFENLANKILEEKSNKFTEANKTNIESILNPLNYQIKEFRERVDTIYAKDTEGRVELSSQIKQLSSLNQKMSEDANNLTKALKGDNKAQGNWGEVVLERLLENSGLKKGSEYFTQESCENAEGDKIRPDVVIKLPEGKHIVVDSKVSLVSYEQYCNTAEPDKMAGTMKEHIRSLKTHVNGLASKSYDSIVSMKTLDFIIMFVPVEGALLAALSESDLFDYAYRKNIVVTGPSTLLATLRVVENIWRYERQNQNAQLIADEAGKIIDKLVMSSGELEEVSKLIDKLSGKHELAYKRLYTGGGAVVKRSEKMKALGAKTTKTFSDTLLSEAELSQIEFQGEGESSGELSVFDVVIEEASTQ